MSNTNELLVLLDKLYRKHTLTEDEFLYIFEHGQDDERFLKELVKKADRARQKTYGTRVYVRGIIEITNFCKNNCMYCGIRKGNSLISRYRLSREEIVQAAMTGYDLGFRSFVLQGGEDEHITDDMLRDTIQMIKRRCPESAITLSLGERSVSSLRMLKEAGADRYLLREETADKAHYELLHPREMSHGHRMETIKLLKSLGYQTGCGFMVGTPYQSVLHIIKDLVFIRDLQPEMVGIGPFIPSRGTPFKDKKAGSVELTLFLLSLIRVMLPEVLLPATTALSTLAKDGRIRGIQAGANVLMPNLTPKNVRGKYEIYENKAYEDEEAAENLAAIRTQMESIGFRVMNDRGHHISRWN